MIFLKYVYKTVVMTVFSMARRRSENICKGKYIIGVGWLICLLEKILH